MPEEHHVGTTKAAVAQGQEEGARPRSQRASGRRSPLAGLSLHLQRGSWADTLSTAGAAGRDLSSALTTFTVRTDRRCSGGVSAPHGVFQCKM